jgi:hypothetical protein
VIGPVECYAQRLLNPFRGAMHVICYAAAEAVTTDGLHWDIYVANDQLLEGLDGVCGAQISDLRYGRWSAAEGLRRGPLYPSADFRRMEEMGAVVYEHLRRWHGRVPFPFRDRYELWLLDTGDRPLALLHSAVDQGDLAGSVWPHWRVGLAAQARFASAALGEDGRQGRCAGQLAAYINGRAGDPPRAQWFRREADGSGTGMQVVGAVSQRLTMRRLERGAFPPLGLSAQGHDETHARLIEDFHAWQAAWLLVLPDLDPAIRGQLERCARQQALEVQRLHRLYPHTIDRQAIRAALVEAVLRRAEAGAAGREERVSPFYMELDPGPPA